MVLCSLHSVFCDDSNTVLSLLAQSAPVKCTKPVLVPHSTVQLATDTMFSARRILPPVWCMPLQLYSVRRLSRLMTLKPRTNGSSTVSRCELILHHQVQPETTKNTGKPRPVAGSASRLHPYISV